MLSVHRHIYAQAVFRTARSMKHIVPPRRGTEHKRRCLETPPRWAQHLARHSTFEYVTLLVIFLNAIWVAVDLELNPATTLLEAEPIFQVTDNLHRKACQSDRSAQRARLTASYATLLSWPS